MKKLNNKGFALAEILVVTVFVMVIFSIIYTNFFPIMAEYERRESYDDVDGKYAAYWFKKMIEKDNIVSVKESTINSYHYYKLQCGDFLDLTQKDLCKNLVERYGITKDASSNPSIYITKYKTEDFKSKVNSNPTLFTSGFQEYVKYLPKYDDGPILNRYRIIIEFHRTEDDNDYYAYATMEVSK